MEVRRFEDEDQWKLSRLGKITGTRVTDIMPKLRGDGKRKGYYEVIAERLALQSDGENAMDRGLRLEPEAIARFESETGKKVDSSLILLERSDNPSIAISPDGMIGKTEALEVKCLNTASHLEALLTDKIPSEYWNQVLQYFVVNDDLQVLHFVFYDPRIQYKEYFVKEVHRSQVHDAVNKVLDVQMKVLREIDDIVLKLSDF